MTDINRLAPPGPGPSAASSTRQTWWCEHAWLGGDTVADAVAVTVEDGVITAVRPDSAPSGRTLRGLVIPGLANAHSHAFHRALRSRTQRDRGSFWTWRSLMYAAAGRLTPERYRDLARAVYAEMAMAGIANVGEFHYLHHDTAGRPYSDPNTMGHALIDAAHDAGIRLTLLDTCYLTAGADGTPLPAGPQQRFSDGDAERWACRVESLHAAAGTGIVVGAALHSVRAVPVAQMATVVDWAARHRAPLHIHSSEQTAEVDQCLAVHGCTPTALMREHGVLGERTTAVHATHLSDRDIDDLRHTSTGVCFCPTTERDLGDGVGPAGALIDGPFSLGSDSQAVIDLFEEARAVELDERLVRRERGLFPAVRLLASATADGHRALGDPGAGVLRAGAPADLVALDLHSVRTAGGGATVENIVFACAAADVTDVVISGRIVVADRVHVRIPDVGRVLATAIDALMEDR